MMNGGAGAGALQQPKTVLITGVSRGLGRALALELAERGNFIIGCSRSQDKLNSLRNEISSRSSSSSSSPTPCTSDMPPDYTSDMTPDSTSDKHLFMNVDVRSNSSVEELARAVMEKKCVPDIIVNNAGTINRNNILWEVPVEEFDAVIDTNLKGTANILRHFVPLMVESKQGVIVNMSSVWGRSGVPKVAPYCASKWAIEGLTQSVAKELPCEMAIVALSPGVINTDMLASCLGSTSYAYQTPDTWAPKAAHLILNLTMFDNGASLSVDD